MAKSKKCLLYKHEDLSLDPQTYGKKSRHSSVCLQPSMVEEGYGGK